MLEIANIKIGLKYPPLIIAEMSGNHNQTLDRAFKIVEAAARSGAHTFKMRTYNSDTITLDVNEGEFFIGDEAAFGKGNLSMNFIINPIHHGNGMNQL